MPTKTKTQMKAKIEIKMDNAAFQDDDRGGNELARILREVADMAESGCRSCAIYDVNGSKVGKLVVADGNEVLP